MVGHPWGKMLVKIMINLMIIVGLMGAGGVILSPVPAWADGAEVAATEGTALFETNCAGCHPKGGNIIKRGKTLKLKPLTRRHLDSVEAIATFVTNGKGLMSAYGDILSPEEISAVSDYVWQQAQANWQP